MTGVVTPVVPRSYTSVQADGSTNIFATPPYIAKAHIHAYVSNADNSGYDEVAGYSWVTGSTLQLAQDAAALAGKTVFITRVTPIDAAAVVFAGGGLDPGDLNLAVTQMIYAQQESVDALSLFGEVLDVFLGGIDGPITP